MSYSTVLGNAVLATVNDELLRVAALSWIRVSYTRYLHTPYFMFLMLTQNGVELDGLHRHYLIPIIKLTSSNV